MVDLTVAIPTYNSEHRLSDVLEKLKDCIAYSQQNSIESFTWEIIVVDNNSLDNTAKLVREYQNNWSSDYPLKYYFAPKQGAAFARQKAVEKARGELIAFLDDDNLPNSDWVFAAYRFGKEHLQAGAYGSQIHGYFFEQKSTDRLPNNFNQIACFLAIVERGDLPFCYQPQNKILPPAAGLVVRKQVWLDAVPPQLVLNHKGKEAGLASEDLEALMHIQQAGWEIWYNPAMKIRHKIPNSRLQPEYLKALVRCVGLSKHQLRMMSLKNWQKPFALAVYLTNDFRRLLLHLLKYGSKVQIDIIAACQMELLIGSLKSPLFLWKKQYLESQKRQVENNERELFQQIVEAIEGDLFSLYCQPLSYLDNTKLFPEHLEIFLGREAEKNKILSLENFKSIAKQYHLSLTLDRLLIRKLFSQITNRDRFIYQIELSTASFQDSRFIDFLTTELTQCSISPSIICFSLPESIAIANFKQVTQFIAEIKKLGFLFAITQISYQGMNNNYLSKISVDYLQVDNKLATELTENCPNKKVAKFKKYLENNQIQIIYQPHSSDHQLFEINLLLSNSSNIFKARILN